MAHCKKLKIKNPYVGCSIFARMDIQCTEKELFILKKVANAAAEPNVPCWFIGGF